MIKEISDNIRTNIISIMHCKAFECYCKNADALLDYSNLRPGRTINFYGTRFYPDKMIETYGEDFMSKFDNWIYNKDHEAKIQSLLDEIEGVYMTGMYDSLKSNKNESDHE